MFCKQQKTSQLCRQKYLCIHSTVFLLVSSGSCVEDPDSANTTTCYSVLQYKWTSSVLYIKNTIGWYSCAGFWIFSYWPIFYALFSYKENDLHVVSTQTLKVRSESPLHKKGPALSSLVTSKKGGRRLRIDLKKGDGGLTLLSEYSI